MAKKTAFRLAAITSLAGDRRSKDAWRSVSKGMLLCLSFAILTSQAHAAQPRSFLTPIRSVTAPAGAANLCQTYAWACSVSTHGSSISSSDLAAIRDVNRAINRSVRFVDDQKQHGAQERWSLPTARGGDCEDFALLKKHELIRRGFPAQALLVATALDRKRRGHAVLIVRTDAGDLVLDNLTDRIKPWSDTGYVFLRMQNPAAPNRWVSLVSAN